MKVQTTTIYFLRLISFHQFVFGFANWQCNIKNSEPSRIAISLDGHCSDSCQEISSNLAYFTCGPNKQKYTSHQIQEIEFLNYEFRQINSFEFKNFTSLETLYRNKSSTFDQNNVHSIEKNTFKYLKKLKSLFMQNNSIEFIEAESFADLINLTTLILASNNLSSINETTFSGLYNLKTLNICMNNITFIQKNAFKKLGNLNYLNLKSNSITHIEFGTFDNLTKILHLDLSQNKLWRFDFNLIRSMNRTLKALHIEQNQLTDLDVSKNFSFLTLEELNLSENKLNCNELKFVFSSSNGGHQEIKRFIHDCPEKLMTFNYWKAVIIFVVVFVGIGISIGWIILIRNKISKNNRRSVPVIKCYRSAFPSDFKVRILPDSEYY